MNKNLGNNKVLRKNVVLLNFSGNKHLKKVKLRFLTSKRAHFKARAFSPLNEHRAGHGTNLKRRRVRIANVDGARRAVQDDAASAHVSDGYVAAVDLGAAHHEGFTVLVLDLEAVLAIGGRLARQVHHIVFLFCVCLCGGRRGRKQKYKKLAVTRARMRDAFIFT